MEMLVSQTAWLPNFKSFAKNGMNCWCPKLGHFVGIFLKGVRDVRITGIKLIGTPTR
jgi:hypothetical protein